MKTDKKDSMRKEYRREDLGVGVRGKYYQEIRKNTNVVLLSPDVASVFPDDESVNKALRTVIDIGKITRGKTVRTGKRSKAHS